MIGVLIQNAVLIALLTPLWWCMARTFRRPAAVHWLWIFLLLKFLVPPLFVIPVALPEVPGLLGIAESTIAQVLLGATWVTGSAYVLFTNLKRAEGFRQLIVRRGNIHAPACDLAEQADPGGFFKTPEVVLVDAVHSPMVCGLGSYSWILFPKDLWFGISTAQRRSLLAHELAHFRRGDCFVRLVELMVTIVFWWHPTLWFIKQEIERSEEDCCDAIAAKEGSKAYARALLSTLDFLSEPEQFRPLISALLSWHSATTERRIKRILSDSVEPIMTVPQRFGISILGTTLLVCSPHFLVG